MVATQSNPNPHFFITKNKSRLKVYDSSKIYLNDSDNFELELFNPTDKKVLAKIYINGNLISTSGIVLKPAQRYFLDRFIDVQKKFNFSTYNVEGSNEQVKKAIEKNGLIEVEFYNEYVPLSSFNWGNTSTGTYVQPNYWGGIGTPVNPYIVNCNSVPLNGSINLVGSAKSVNYVHTVGTCINTGTITYSTNQPRTLTIANGSSAFSTINQPIKEEKTNEIETGRIEEGKEISNQTFVTDHGTYNSLYNVKSSFQILPVSQKAIVSKEIRDYCTNCSYRVRNKNWVYCPKCSKKL